jgi:benzylsuccinate CoA-transferase BbsF subunit
MSTFMGPTLLDIAVNQKEVLPQGNHPDCVIAAPYGCYRCLGEDRWCVIAVFTDAEWQAFCRTIGRPDLAKDTRFATLPARKEHEDELDRIVEAWTEQHTAEEIMQELQKNSVPAGVVQTSEDLHNDPQIKQRHHFWSFDHPVIGPHPVDSLPFRLSQTPSKPHRREPLLGEHNGYVCTEILGLSDEEFVSLLQSGAFGPL